MEYRRIVTTPEVWAVIHASHRAALQVFSSRTHPQGDPYGDPHVGMIETSYAFDGAIIPLLWARTTWSINPDNLAERQNERHTFWLCVPTEAP